MAHVEGNVQPLVLELKAITKSFSGVPALRGVNLNIRAGEVHALLGANGAGKSTLMKIVTGACLHDGGEVLLEGRQVQFRSPADAKREGIHCVYQEVDASLVPQLTVAENIMLDEIGASDGKVFVSFRRMVREAEEILQSLEVNIAAKQKVADLTIAQKQMVLLARILKQKAKIIIFDEPTAPLSGTEVETFFRLLSELKSRGTACIFITHRLPEVMDHADYVTVMRDGQNVFEAPKSAVNMELIVSHMLNRSTEEAKELYPKQVANVGDVLLSVRALAKGHKVKGVDLQVRSGQIVAVVGLVGAGKTEITRMLSGADKPDSGEICLKGVRQTFKDPADAINAGIVAVPEERRKQGVILQESVANNLSLPLLDKVSSWGMMSKGREVSLAERIIRSLGIKVSGPDQPVKYLSGGNQQKVAIGKWMEKNATVFLFDEPTKGVDIGAKSDIFRIISSLAAEGKGVLYFTSELDEGLGIGDEIVVLYDGRIAAVLPKEEATEEYVLQVASSGMEAKQ